MGCNYLSEFLLSLLLDTYLGEELLGPMVVLFNFLRNHQAVSHSLPLAHLCPLSHLPNQDLDTDPAQRSSIGKTTLTLRAGPWQLKPFQAPRTQPYPPLRPPPRVVGPGPWEAVKKAK